MTLLLNKIRLLPLIVVIFLFGNSGNIQTTLPGVHFNQVNHILYVDSSVAISGNGSSWANAFKDLSEALTAAAKKPGIDSILVAKGTYYPLSIAGDGTSNRDKAFVLLPNVSIIGGFPSG